MRRARDEGPAMTVLRGVVGVGGELLITVGLLTLLFVAWQLWWTDVTANHEQAAEVQSLERRFLRDDAVIPTPSPTPTASPTPKATRTPTATPIAVRLGQPFAIMR
ncbi:MAG: class E sortase, partial [Actinomycetota bacterium]